MTAGFLPEGKMGKSTYPKKIIGLWGLSKQIWDNLKKTISLEMMLQGT